MTTKLLPAGYQAALEGAAWYVIPQPGCLSIRGRDRASFLQRQTTQDVRLLAGNHALPTTLTSPNARILDVLYLLSGPDDTITALTLPGQGATTTSDFKKRVFFIDQVEVEDISQIYAQIDLIGPHRVDLTHLVGFNRQPEADEILTVEWEGYPVHLLYNSAPVWIGWRMLIPNEILQNLSTIFEQGGAERLTSEVYHLQHLENGIPQVPSELNEDYTPLETGLQGTISDLKGCYTGQEIIARQITYDKITQRLCGLRLSGQPLSGNSIWFEGRSIGRVTSAAISPRFGHIGLAMIKRPHNEPGVHVSVGNQFENSEEASVCTLPFEF